MTEKELNGDSISATGQNDEGDSYAENYALAIAFALPIGMIIGLMVLDNIAIGSAIGLALSPIFALFMKNRKSGE